MFMLGNALIVTDQNEQAWNEPTIDGAKTRRGLVPRDYNTHPVGYYHKGAMRSVDLTAIPQSEWASRLKLLREGGALLSDIRKRGKNGQRIPSTDQNGRGYCWFHSGTSACLLVRARDNQPFVDLSAYAGACKIKGFRDEGGWGAQGVDFMVKYGIPSSQYWPQRAVDPRYDNAETWKNALLHRVDEGWIDLAAAQYDRKLAWEQVVTCLLTGHPVVCDYNWWGHSVCGMDLVDGAKAFESCRSTEGKLVSLQEFEAVWDMSDNVTGGFGIRIWNSWGDSWSENGEGILVPSKAVPDGSVAIRTMTVSVA